VILDCQSDSADNSVCPIKLLLILALRLGNLSAKTIDEVLLDTQSRHDKTVVWKHPERPVFCAVASGGTALYLDKPAGNHQLAQTLATVGPIAGFLNTVRPHDLRRGSACDIVNLEEGIKGVTTPTVAAALSHTNALPIPINQPNESLDNSTTTPDATQDDTPPIDPVVLAQGYDPLAKEVDTALYDQIQKPAPVVGELTSDPVTFVITFSKINLTTSQSLAGPLSEKNRYLARWADQKGNSRDEPSSFQYSCKNEQFGCEYQHALRVQLTDHERTCKAAIRPSSIPP